MLKRLVLFLMLSFLMVACSAIEQSVAEQSIILPNAQRQTWNAPRTATAKFWQTQGVTPTTNPFALTATQLIFEVTGTQLAFDSIGTQFAFEVTSGTYAYEATSGTVTAREATRDAQSTMTQEANQARRTATAIQLENIQVTQAAETAIVIGCDFARMNYHTQILTIHMGFSPIAVNAHGFNRMSTIFDCETASDEPSRPYDFHISIIVPQDTTEDEIATYTTQAINLLADYPFEATTSDSDNLLLQVRLADFKALPSHEMNFSYSDMLSAIDDGLEGEALLEALGGVEAIAP